MRTLVIAALMFFSLAPAALADTQSFNTCVASGKTAVSCCVANGGDQIQCQSIYGGTGNSVNNPSQTQGTSVNNIGGSNVTLINPLKAQNLKAFLKDILAFIIDIGTIVIILMIVYVGYLFVIAQGAPGKIEEARKALLWTVVGALILLGSQAITISLEATVNAITGP